MKNEWGSDFHWIGLDQELNENCISKNPYILFGTGRYAIGSLINMMIEQEGWKRLLIPNYYCPQVTSYISRLINISYYNVKPGEEIKFNFTIQQGDVLLVNNLFGLNQKPDYSIFQDEITVIEDHSHDPFSDWSCNSEADWCFASLRKTIPIPDGGILWSCLGKTIPVEPDITVEHRQSSTYKFCAMLAKEHYLKGKAIPKHIFRDMFVNGENGYDENPDVSGISQVSRNGWKRYPIQISREIRKHNYLYLTGLLERISNLDILHSKVEEDIVPFSVVLLLKDRETRHAVRNNLISSNIYPAILWDQASEDQTAIENIEFSQRMLSIHCDMRYSINDMDSIFQGIKNALLRKKASH